MKKKIITSIIILLAVALGVYIFIQMPMLSIDQNENETGEHDNDSGKDNVNSVFDPLTDDTQIVAIGDSLTEGVGDTTEQGGYIGVLDKTINKDKQIAHFTNFGKRGNRTDQLLERLEQQEIKSAIENANIILITIGANDIMQVVKENFENITYDLFTTEQQHFENRLTNILNKINEYNRHAQIYLLGLYNPFHKYFGEIREFDLIVDEWNTTSEQISSKFGNVIFIPINDIFINEENNLFAEDNFHPNMLGYEKMAERVLQYFANEERWVP